MKTRILSFVVILALVLYVASFAIAEESPVRDTAPFVGRWSLNVADYPGFAEEGLTQGTITMELHEDGAGCTYYEGMKTSEYGYMFYMDYYVAVTADGEAESSLYTLSEDGLTLTLKDIGGAWELAYQREVA